MKTGFYNFLLILIVCLSIACRSSQQGKEHNRFENSVISLEKTPCYGTCPVYLITVKGTGEVIYEGKQHVAKVGKYTKQLSEKEINKLFNKFECASFFDFRSEYTDHVTDLPTTFISFEHRGFKKKITDYYGAPEELKKLERMVEEIAEEEEGWEEINYE